MRCFAKSDFHVAVEYQPGDRYWTFQWIETGIFVALAGILAGFSAWWLRRMGWTDRLSEDRAGLPGARPVGPRASREVGDATRAGLLEGDRRPADPSVRETSARRPAVRTAQRGGGRSRPLTKQENYLPGARSCG